MLIWTLYLAAGVLSEGVQENTASNTKNIDFVQYAIVGAGPAGIQMGAFLQAKGRSYRIFERNQVPCSFYELFPRHDQLISINKRYTGYADPEFNLRHDWNSLLSPDGVSGSPLFRDYSTKFFPNRREILDYCSAYVNFHNVSIEYNRTIVRVSRKNKTDKNILAPQKNFTLTDSTGRKTRCQYLIWATARSPYKPYLDGIEHTIGYDDPAFVTDPEYYVDKRVLILGLGNTAFEIAQSMREYAGSVNLIGRSYGGLRFAYNTHYVGDLRAVNAHATDTFLLKSLDTIDPGFDLVKARFEKNTTNGKIRLRFAGDETNYNYRDPYDVVIRALGWRVNLAPFDENVRPNTILDDKYPETNFNYESTNVPNLFFAGTLMHGLDFRKAAGGFIHGFRYLVRTLHRYLEVREHEVPVFSDDKVISPANPATIARAIHNRIKRSSGLYQMFNVLCDVVIWDQHYAGGSQADYVEEIPCASITDQASHADTPLFSFTFDYGHALNGRADNSIVTLYPGRAHKSQFLHPVLRFYRPKLPPSASGTDAVEKFVQFSEFHIMEDFMATWDVEEIHLAPIEAWIRRCLNGDFITQEEQLENFAVAAYGNLTAEQKKKGHTVHDPFYGTFEFPNEEEFAKFMQQHEKATQSSGKSEL